MTVRAIDESGDIVTSGEQFITGADEIAQTVKTRLRLFLGEYFRDINEGVPWWESILGKDGTLSSKESILKIKISQTPGVIRLVSFTTDFNITTREYSVIAGILTAFGEIEVVASNG